MPIPTFDYQPLPFAEPRHTPNTTRLQAIYGATGEQLAQIALQRGQAQSAALGRVASIISGGAAAAREGRARKEAIAIRAAEQDAERKEREAERAARAAERAADKLERQTGQDREAARHAVDRATPGPQSGAMLALAQKDPASAARFRMHAPLPARSLPSSLSEYPPAVLPGQVSSRVDGTTKGSGFLGSLTRPDGSVSSEISIGVNIGGQEVEIPTLVPTLTASERSWLLNNDISDPRKIPESIIDKAVDHATRRIKSGQSPFAQSGKRESVPFSPQMAPDGGAYPVLDPTAEQALAAGDRQFRVERSAAEDARYAKADVRAGVDDTRQAAALALQAKRDAQQIDYQNRSLGIQQQTANTATANAQARLGGGGSGTLTPAYRNVLERVIGNIPRNRRGPKVAHAERLLDEGNETELKDFIRLNAIESEGIDSRNMITGRMATIASLVDTKAVLREMRAKGVPTNIFAGTVEDVARKLGTSTNPEYVEMSNRLMGTLINYRRAATGVAFGEREAAQYERMFPNYRNTLPVNEALMDGLLREMTTYDRVFWEHKLGKDGAAMILGTPAAAGGGGADDPVAALIKKYGGG